MYVNEYARIYTLDALPQLGLFHQNQRNIVQTIQLNIIQTMSYLCWILAMLIIVEYRINAQSSIFILYTKMYECTIENRLSHSCLRITDFSPTICSVLLILISLFFCRIICTFFSVVTSFIRLYRILFLYFFQYICFCMNILSTTFHWCPVQSEMYARHASVFIWMYMY